MKLNEVDIAPVIFPVDQISERARLHITKEEEDKRGNGNRQRERFVSPMLRMESDAEEDEVLNQWLHRSIDEWIVDPTPRKIRKYIIPRNQSSKKKKTPTPTPIFFMFEHRPFLCLVLTFSRSVNITFLSAVDAAVANRLQSMTQRSDASAGS